MGGQDCSTSARAIITHRRSPPALHHDHVDTDTAAQDTEVLLPSSRVDALLALNYAVLGRAGSRVGDRRDDHRIRIAVSHVSRDPACDPRPSSSETEAPDQILSLDPYNHMSTAHYGTYYVDHRMEDLRDNIRWDAKALEHFCSSSGSGAWCDFMRPARADRDRDLLVWLPGFRGPGRAHGMRDRGHGRQGACSAFA